MSNFFTLPLNPGRLAALVENLHDRLGGPPLRVILLDDEQSALDYYGAILREHGLEVRAVQDPLLALGLLDEFKPDLLLTDIEMPGCRGPELVTIMRQRAEYAHLPVLFLTAMDSAQNLLQARAAAVEDILPKPVTPALLLTAVRAQGWRHRAWLRAETEHRRQDAQARLQLEQLRVAIDEHAIISTANAKGRITHINDKFCATSGYSRAELIGQNHRLVKSGLHPPDFYRKLWRTITAGEIWQGELCNRRKDGSLYWVEATIMPVRDMRGQVMQYISIRTDITARKQKEDALRESEERFAFAVEGPGDGVWDWNMLTGEMALSGNYEGMLGFARGELGPVINASDAFMRSVHPDDLARARQTLQDYLAGRLPAYTIELRLRCKDGGYKWILCRSTVAGRDEAGKPVRMIGIHSDISERKENEERLALFRRIFDASQQCIGISDGQGRQIYQNRAHAEAYGYRDEEIIGRSFEMFMPDDPGLEPTHDFLAAIAAGRTWTGLLPLRRKNGSIFMSASNVGFIKDERGQPQYLFNIFTDFTEDLARREELAQAKEAAERANQAKSDFLSSMSHELRTPMNAIIGFAQMLEYDAGLNADQLDNAHEILKAGRHLLELINEVLDLAKIESGRVDLLLEPVSLATVIADCRQLIQPLAVARNIEIHLDIPPGKAVRADRVRLKQVLLNLLSNAVKYNREYGGIRLDATASPAGRMRITVIDTGMGIPAERLEELFQPFNRLAAERSGVEGTGIGLTITRRLVEIMGGEVGVASEVGKGSRFWIDLPADAPPARAAVAGAGDGERTAAGTAPERPGHVLCIDDNPVNLKLIAHMLGMRPNLRVITAHAPELGIELALTHQPDLILLDINMPGMDGYQVLEILKADARLRRIPVVAVTANAMPRDIERGKTAGFRDYLTKPLDVDRFLETIDRCLTDGENRT